MKVTNTKQVKNLFTWLHGVASKDASRPVLMAIHVKGKIMEATDGHMLAIAMLDEPILENGLWRYEGATKESIILEPMVGEYPDAKVIVDHMKHGVKDIRQVFVSPYLMAKMCGKFFSVQLQSNGESLLIGYSNENGMYPPGKYIGVLMGMRKESGYDLMGGFEEYV